ncbi:MAG: thioredoxin family protein [Thaumarchaeota archaeon]|nr:thioredoxin family protein [Nitrososphaerota archaeon]
MTENHTFEIFSANCPLCRNIEIRTHEGCNQTTYDVNNMTAEIREKMEKYGIKAVPTTVIDGKYKIVGTPDFPLACGEDLFKKLQKEYSL